MQIHELNNYGGALNSGAFLVVDNGGDTGKVSVTQLLSDTNAAIDETADDLNGRIDNIIAGGTAPSAAEVTDARRGADGTNYRSLGTAIRSQVSGLQGEIDDISEIDESFPLDESMFQMGYIDAVVGNAPVYRSSTQRFVTKEGTTFNLRKGSIIHIFDSVLEQYGAVFQITKLNTDGTIESVNGLIGRDYVVPEDGRYILMFRTNWSQDIPSISDYLARVSIENNFPIIDVSKSYQEYINESNDNLLIQRLSGIYHPNGSIGTPDPTNQEQYTNMIEIPPSKRLIFEQKLSEKKTMFIRCVIFDEDGVILRSVDPFNLVVSSSAKLEFKFNDSDKYVVFTFRSYGATTTAVTIYADNSKNESKYTPFYSLVTPPKVPLVNHRGYEALAPENSIPAFTLAGERGAFGCETDVSSTSDGVLIIMHDNTVDRTTDGSGTVTSLTYAQIQALHIDAGANVDQYPPEELIVPTFDDFMKICRKYGMIATIEVKLYGDLGNYVSEMLSTIYKYGMQNNVMILSSNSDVIKMFRAYDKDIQITTFCTSTSVIDTYKEYPNMGVSIGKSTANIGTLVEYAHSNKMLATLYTADNSTEVENLKQYFPDFITTETTNQA